MQRADLAKSGGPQEKSALDPCDKGTPLTPQCQETTGGSIVNEGIMRSLLYSQNMGMDE